jgi:3',5'-cyclic AMP phosphodiesterase CpdA
MDPTRRRLLRLGLAAGCAGLLPRGLSRARATSRPDRLHWLATADSGSGDANQRAVGLAMARLLSLQPIDLVLMAGDNLYNDGDIRLVERAFQQPYRELIAAGVPFHAVLGNHDIRSDDGAGQLAYPGFGMQGRWYNLQRGPVEFFLIDTNSNVPWQQQLPWLRQALAASTAPWKVVVGHHPIRSSGFYGDDPAAIARLGPHFRRHGVQLYINGHEHNYERTRPIDGTTYLSVGNGGASLRPVRLGTHSAVVASVFGFTSLRADATALTIEAWNSRSEHLDRAQLNRDGSLAASG